MRTQGKSQGFGSKHHEKEPAENCNTEVTQVDGQTQVGDTQQVLHELLVKTELVPTHGTHKSRDQ